MEDVAGLGIQELSLLAQSDKSGQAFNQIVSILQREKATKAKTEAADVKAKAFTEAANAKEATRIRERNEDRQAKIDASDQSFKNKLDLVGLSENLAREKENRTDIRKRQFESFKQNLSETPEKVKERELKFRQAESTIKNLDSLSSMRGQVTPAQQAGIDAKIQDDVRDAIIQVGPDYNDPELTGYMDIINEFGNEPYYISIPEADVPGLKFGIDVPGERLTLPLYQGKQLTMQDVRDTAEANGMTIQEVLQKLNVNATR